MMNRLRRWISLLLVIVMIAQVLCGCSSEQATSDDGYIKEELIYEERISNENIPEEQLQAEYIAEHLIYEEGLYEITIGEQYICQTYIIETVISETSADNFAELLPDEIHDYSINWGKVLSEFAVGTTVIIAVGVVNHATHGATVFMFGTAASIAKEAFIGGVIDAAMRVILSCTEDDPPNEKVAKYAIEGFAEGYMWGAISAVAFNFVLPKQLVSSSLGKLKINNSGIVKNKAGQQVGKALYDLASDHITLIDDAERVLGFFKSNGDEILNIAKVALKPNTSFVLGMGDDAIKYFTDAAGKIYRIGDDLAKNATYKIGNAVYETDELGRIIKVTFDKLSLKPEGQARKVISSSIDDIGKGYQQLGDQRGHIIADRFNGDNSLANMVPMSPDLNQRDFKAIEDLWAEAITNGKTVNGTIEFIYEGLSFRPGRMDVEYLIDGLLDTARFFN